MKYTAEQINKILHLRSPKATSKKEITQILTDSRRLSYPEKTLFIALKTKRQDGHQYIAELYQKGVRSFLVKKNFDTQHFPNAEFFKVSDPLSALQELVQYWRGKFAVPVIGITGSNGKTIVKEWLFQLLKKDFHIIRSPKSFNSQSGVPLSVAEINTSHELAVFEAGISQPGEMEKLEKMIQPSLGIFTNIGEAHAEGFSSIRQKIREKLQLFSKTSFLIYRKDDAVLDQEIQAFQKAQLQKGHSLTLFPWSTEETSNVRLTITAIQKAQKTSTHSVITARYDRQEIVFGIPFSDNGSIENAIHCLALMLHLGVAPSEIAERMEKLQPVAMRLEMKPGIQDCLLINDSYNSDFASIEVALDFLFHQKQKNKHTFILSDVEQSGTDVTTLYQKIARLLVAKKLDRFIGVGEHLCKQKQLFQSLPETSFYPSTAQFINHLKEFSPKEEYPFHEEVILLKGARSFTFEKIGKLLEQKKHQNELHIDLNAIAHNLKTYQSLLQPSVKTMVMVKAFSYGSGSAEIAGLLQYHRIDYLAVANIDEGIHLRKNGITLPILILNPDPFYFEELIQWKLEPELYALSILKSFNQKISSLGITDYAVHLKLDTGMHRLGFTKEQLPELILFLKEQSSLKIASIFSHLAASEKPEMDLFTQKQGHLFGTMSTRIMKALPYATLRHLCNSSGISRHPSLQFDMVRLGIGLYGIDPAIEDQLETVHSLKATIVQIKDVKSGETVGYGRAGKVQKAKRIAVVSIGYADGYLRSLGLGKGKMWLHQKWTATIGEVCMDMLMLDVTDIPEAQEGDFVSVFGQKPKIEKLAAAGGTIPYEILSGLSRRIIRIYTQE